VVLIHRFYVLGVDLHFLKLSSPNSLYFGRNRRFYLPICAQIDKFFAQHPEPAKAGLPTGNSRPEAKFPDSKKCDRVKPALRPVKAAPPAKAGPSTAKAGPCLSQVNAASHQAAPAPAPSATSPPLWPSHAPTAATHPSSSPAPARSTRIAPNRRPAALATRLAPARLAVPQRHAQLSARPTSLRAHRHRLPRLDRK
jgi:hypothetical protein